MSKNEIKCPKCGEVFKIDEVDYAVILNQVKNAEFDEELHQRLKELEQHKKSEIEVLRVNSKLEKESLESELNEQISKLNNEITNLKEKTEMEKKLAINVAVDEMKNIIDQKEKDLGKFKTDIEILKNSYESRLNAKDKEIALYKDMKAKMSTKMVGESLEQHCNIEFNKLRMTAFPKAYFEKDNDASQGSKGDFIFRDYAEDGTELISIMFEMKNESEETVTKHKNEDFFAKLDKDRKEKGCEYAVLVSLLEKDNEIYDSGIVDVSYKYEKMYVVRPQCFIPIISLLRNASLNSLKYKQQLIEYQNQNIDVTKFEGKLLNFKDSFDKNVKQAKEKFDSAIKEIDATIGCLQKIKDYLLASDDKLCSANKKVQDITIKKLTFGNPTMTKKFAKLKNEDN